MKKEYQLPVTEISEMEPVDMVALSNTISSESATGAALGRELDLELDFEEAGEQ